MAAIGWRGTSSVTMALAVRATFWLYPWFVGVRRGELFGVEWSWCARVDISIQPAVVESECCCAVRVEVLVQLAAFFPKLCCRRSFLPFVVFPSLCLLMVFNIIGSSSAWFVSKKNSQPCLLHLVSSLNCHVLQEKHK
jgi:hypothetical protein